MNQWRPCSSKANETLTHESKMSSAAYLIPCVTPHTDVMTWCHRRFFMMKVRNWRFYRIYKCLQNALTIHLSIYHWFGSSHTVPRLLLSNKQSLQFVGRSMLIFWWPSCGWTAVLTWRVWPCIIIIIIICITAMILFCWIIFNHNRTCLYVTCSRLCSSRQTLNSPCCSSRSRQENLFLR